MKSVPSRPAPPQTPDPSQSSGCFLESRIAEVLAKSDAYPPGMLPRELEQQVLDILSQIALGRVDPDCNYSREDIYAEDNLDSQEGVFRNDIPSLCPRWS